MNSLQIPGFTAEASISQTSTISSMASDANQIGSEMIIPQLMRQVPCWHSGGWQICDIPYDDPGGWGVPPWIGDVSGRQCVARCNRITNPIRRADCLEGC